MAGLGYWGPNLARNFAGAPAAASCVAVRRRRGRAAERVAAAPGRARARRRSTTLLADDELDAVVLATPVPTHAGRWPSVLEAGKHCFVEKPLAPATVADAERAVAAADAPTGCSWSATCSSTTRASRSSRRSPTGELGDIHYVYSNRLNLGKLRTDENALWSLGAHDVSVLLHLLRGEEPAEVEARGEAYMRRGVEDVVFGFLRFPSGRAAHLHLSWLDPHKERRFTVVGSKRMATFDDMDLERKVTVYDKGFDSAVGGYGEYITRSGDIWSPRSRTASRCGSSASTSSTCVREGGTPRSDGRSGLRVVRVLEPAPQAGDSDASQPGARVRPSDRAPGAASSATASGSARTVRARRARSSTPAPSSATGARSRTARCSASRPKLGAAPRRRASGAAARARAAARRSAPARSCSPARGSARARSSATRRTCASARGRAGTVIGRGSRVDNDVAIGARVRVQTASTSPRSRWSRTTSSSGPGVPPTNDDTMAAPRAGRRAARRALRRACRIGGGAVLRPGVEVGEEAFVAAGAVSRATCRRARVVMGVPARVVREVADADLLERWR